ncbi:NAD(P)-binding protein [Ramicandelaber brevisporus]|nr:NAD(P)-binding protein [Ramicandelaber brevisporus]
MSERTLVVVVGARGGFGQAVAEQAAQRYRSVDLVLTARSASQLADTAASVAAIAPAAAIATLATGDLADSASVERFIQDISVHITSSAGKLGKPYSAAIFILNAGSTGDLSKSVADIDVQSAYSYFASNVAAYAAMAAGFLRVCRGGSVARSCAVVNISSLLAVRAFPYWGLYAAGKAARDMLLAVVAEESKADPRVKSLSYAPGPLDNEMQRSVRETIGDQEQKGIYSSMHSEGNLVPMSKSAGKLIAILQRNEYASGEHIDFYDANPADSDI